MADGNSVRDIKCGNDFASIFGNNYGFCMTEFKVLQSEWNKFFVPCMEYKFNGDAGIYYLIGELKPLSEVYGELSADEYVELVNKLIGNIIAIKENGFLSLTKVVPTIDRIYVDMLTLKVKLVYLPLYHNLCETESEFEYELRNNLAKLITDTPSLYSNKSERLVYDLKSRILSLDEISNKHTGMSFLSDNKGRTKIYSDYEDVIAHESREKHMMLVPVDSQLTQQIQITKPEFVIGKKADQVDGCIQESRLVSRVHCKILQDGKLFLIERLDHTNGTYVNGELMPENGRKRIVDGDIIGIANIEMKVVIE